MGIAILLFFAFVGLVTLAAFGVSRFALSLILASYPDRNSPEAVQHGRRLALNCSWFGLFLWVVYEYCVGRWSSFFFGLGFLPLVAQQLAFVGVWLAQPRASELLDAEVGFNRL